MLRLRLPWLRLGLGFCGFFLFCSSSSFFRFLFLFSFSSSSARSLWLWLGLRTGFFYPPLLQLRFFRPLFLLLLVFPEVLWLPLSFLLLVYVFLPRDLFLRQYPVKVVVYRFRLFRLRFGLNLFRRFCPVLSLRILMRWFLVCVLRPLLSQCCLVFLLFRYILRISLLQVRILSLLRNLRVSGFPQVSFGSSVLHCVLPASAVSLFEDFFGPQESPSTPFPTLVVPAGSALSF